MAEYKDPYEDAPHKRPGNAAMDRKHGTVVDKEGRITDQEAYNKLSEWYATKEGIFYAYCDYFWELRDRLLENDK